MTRAVLLFASLGVIVSTVPRAYAETIHQNSLGDNEMPWVDPGNLDKYRSGAGPYLPATSQPPGKKIAKKELPPVKQGEKYNLWGGVDKPPKSSDGAGSKKGPKGDAGGPAIASDKADNNDKELPDGNRNVAKYEATTEGLLDGKPLEKARTKMEALAVGPRVDIVDANTGKRIDPADITSGRFSGARVLVNARETGTSFTGTIESPGATATVLGKVRNLSDDRFNPRDTGVSAQGVWAVRPDRAVALGEFGVRDIERSRYYYGTPKYNVLARQLGGNAARVAAEVYLFSRDFVFGGGGGGGGSGGGAPPGGSGVNDATITGGAPGGNGGRAPGEKMCFSPEARVTMADGMLKRADEVQVGDLLFNPVRGRGFRVRKLVIGPELNPLVEIRVGKRILRVNQSHVIFTKSGAKQARQVSKRDRVLVGAWGLLKVDSVQLLPVNPRQYTWNFELEADDAAVDDHWLLSEGLVTGDAVLQARATKPAL